MSNNIQKAFKAKSKLRCMADGGLVRREIDPDMLGTGGAARAGHKIRDHNRNTAAQIDALFAPAAASAPQSAQPAEKPKEKSALRSFFGLADGGQVFKHTVGGATTNSFNTPSFELEFADGGRVKGPGGPTDDKVGPVMLSHGEYVLPADTVEIVGRDKLDALRLATHNFVDDDNKPKVSGLRKMADGGTFYVDSEGVASRRLPSREVVPYRQPPAPATTPAAGREVVPYRQPPAPPASTPPASTPPASTPPAGSRLRSTTGRALAGLGGAYAAADGVRNMADEGVNSVNAGDTASGLALLAQAAGRSNPIANAAATGWMAGRIIGDNLSRDTQDAIGGTVNSAVRGTGKTINKGLRALGIDTDFGSDWGVDDSHYLELKHSGGAPATTPPAAAQPSRSAELPGMGKVPDDVRTSSADLPATPVQPDSYQSRRLAEMGVPVDQQNLPPVTEDTRRSLLREGGGTPGQYVNLGSYGGDANLYGTASEPGGRINSFVGVGASARPGGPQEDPIMSEVRSALRGLTAGTGNRGGSTPSGWDRGVYEINKRYDDLLRSGEGRNIVKGLDWSQRHGLSIEAERAKALDNYAQNQTALRGQDINADTMRSNAELQARTQALHTLGTMANQRSTQLAQAQAAQLKALQDAAAAERNAELAADERAVKTRDAFLDARFGPHAEGSEGARRRRADQFFNRLPAGAWQQIAELPPTEQNAVLDSLAQAMEAQDKDLETGRSPYAVGQNATIGALTGYGLRGMNPVGRLAQGATELLGLKFRGLRGKGKDVSDFIGKIPWLNPALGAAAGATLTPSRGAGTQLPDLPLVDAAGNEVSPRRDLDFWLTHGFLADPEDRIFTQGGRTMKNTSSADVEASRKLLREFFNQGR